MSTRVGRAMGRVFIVSLALLGANLIADDAPAGTLPDAGWWTNFGNTGLRGWPEHVIVCDGQVVASGQFITGDGSWKAGAVRRTETGWESMRGRGYPSIRGWCEWRGRLVAIGVFYALPGNQVAVWQDGDWRALGAPLSAGPAGIHAGQDRLLVGAGAGVFEWIGEQWVRLGNPFDSNGQLTILGGVPITMNRETGRVVSLQGDEWREVGQAPAWFDVMGTAGGQLFASATSYYRVDGGLLFTSRVFRWDGATWVSHGPAAAGKIRQLLDQAGQLRAVTTLGADEWLGPSAVLSLEGDAWRPVSEVLGGVVSDAVVDQGRIVVSGNFDVAGHCLTRGLARLDDGLWRPIEANSFGGTNEQVRALLPWRGGLVAAGSFVGIGGEVRPGIAWNDGQAWQPLGEGMADGVFALAEFNGNLVAGGDFLQAGGTAAARVAHWDGQTWSPLGAGLDDRVTALAVYRGELYAGGWFGHSGGTACRGVARWDGTAWQPVAGGRNGRVECLLEYSGMLAAGGDFRRTGELDSACLSFYDGTNWSCTGSVPAGPVLAMTLWNNRLVVGGLFRHVGEAAADGLAILGEEGWNALLLGGDEWRRPWVRSLGVCQGRLVVGLDAGSLESDPGNLALWDGAEWQRPETPAGGSVDAIASWGGSLVVGGRFGQAGGVDSWNIARWDGALVSASLLQSAAFRTGSTVALTWQSRGLSNHTGYEVHRQVGAGERVRLGAVSAQADGRYAFEDPTPAGEAADYWLRELGPLGDAQWIGPIHLDGLPAGLVLGAPSPNPFRDATTLSFSLSRAGRVRITVHDVQGQLVRTLLQQALTPGAYTRRWDGRGDTGAPAPSGAYWLRLQAGDAASARRVMLLR